MFHVSKLKKFVGDLNTPPQPLPIFSEASHPILKPQQVLATRKILKKVRPISQLLIRWEGLPIEEATWEDSDLCLLFLRTLRTRFLLEMGVMI